MMSLGYPPLVELEEKDEIHLKCPEDTTSIGSNSVSTLVVYLVDDRWNLVIG